jgi:hypothetical protein
MHLPSNSNNGLASAPVAVSAATSNGAAPLSASSTSSGTALTSMASPQNPNASVAKLVNPAQSPLLINVMNMITLIINHFGIASFMM